MTNNHPVQTSARKEEPACCIRSGHSSGKAALGPCLIHHIATDFLAQRLEACTQSTAQHSTAQHSTAQHSTAQHSTAQHSTAQHSTQQPSIISGTARHGTARWLAGWLAWAAAS
eukprot:COSAG06_NODE_217_length_20094_cov_61.998500_4_plen_114_part_00